MFWDSSAIVPCLLPEEWSAEAVTLLGSDLAPTMWWAAPVECVSALERRRRVRALEPEMADEARRRLSDLSERMDTVEAHPAVRERAMRLLGVHSLRSADALQLAAALLYCDERPRGERFVCLDERLRAAAALEGFLVLPRR